MSVVGGVGGVEEVDVQVHHVPATVHGRYLVDAPLADEPLPLLVGFHGYAERAEQMLEVLRALRGTRAWALVSVQALHPFYTRTDKVVAGWMTREDRELAIADNIAYVASVIAAVQRDYRTTAAPAYVGFSQGAAMAYRAAAFVQARLSSPPPAAVIVLAGDVPPDVAPVAASLPPVFIGRGLKDDWYTEGKERADVAVLTRAGRLPRTHLFDGGHVWDPSFIAAAGVFLDELFH